MLTNQQIQKFKLLYEKRFGEQLSDEQAAAQAAKLVELVRMVYRPLTKKEFQRFSRREGGTMNG